MPTKRTTAVNPLEHFLDSAIQCASSEVTRAWFRGLRDRGEFFDLGESEPEATRAAAPAGAAFTPSSPAMRSM
jgi:hypothetical protein